MPTQTNDNTQNNNNTQDDEQILLDQRKCTYCKKKLTLRWQHRKNGSTFYRDWPNRKMHGTCFAKYIVTLDID